MRPLPLALIAFASVQSGPFLRKVGVETAKNTPTFCELYGDDSPPVQKGPRFLYGAGLW